MTKRRTNPDPSGESKPDAKHSESGTPIRLILVDSETSPASTKEFAAEDSAPRRSKRRATPGERVHVILPPELAMKLRLAAVRQRRSVSDAATEAITAWLADH